MRLRGELAIEKVQAGELGCHPPRFMPFFGFFVFLGFRFAYAGDGVLWLFSLFFSRFFSLSESRLGSKTPNTKIYNNFR